MLQTAVYLTAAAAAYWHSQVSNTAVQIRHAEKSCMRIYSYCCTAAVAVACKLSAVRSLRASRAGCQLPRIALHDLLTSCCCCCCRQHSTARENKPFTQPMFTTNFTCSRGSCLPQPTQTTRHNPNAQKIKYSEYETMCKLGGYSSRLDSRTQSIQMNVVSLLFVNCRRNCKQTHTRTPRERNKRCKIDSDLEK